MVPIEVNDEAFASLAILQLDVPVLHANKFLPPLEMSAGGMPKLLSKKEGLVAWDERST